MLSALSLVLMWSRAWIRGPQFAISSDGMAWNTNRMMSCQTAVMYWEQKNLHILIFQCVISRSTMDGQSARWVARGNVNPDKTMCDGKRNSGVEHETSQSWTIKCTNSNQSDMMIADNIRLRFEILIDIGYPSSPVRCNSFLVQHYGSVRFPTLGSFKHVQSLTQSSY